MALAVSSIALGAQATLLTQADDQSDQAINRAIKKDPAWRASHHEIRSLTVGQPGAVNNYCLNGDGNLLVCIGDQSGRGEIRTFTPVGRQVGTWKLPIKPGAICVQPDGTIFVGGDGLILKLNSQGQILGKGALPSQNLSQASKEVRQYLAQAGREVTGIAVSAMDVFVAALSPSDYTYVVYRLSKDLKAPKLIVKGLNGCCGQMDIQAHNGDLWVAHNARHLVERYDRTGKKLFSFGQYDRKAASGFGGCCEPKNLRFVGNVLYAAESGPPTAIKRFSLTGKFLGVVALPEFKTGCVRVTTEISKDGSTFFMLDADGGQIHVMAPNKRSGTLP